MPPARASRPFSYVYILESVGTPKHHYVGLTDDLAKRLAAHNGRRVAHTAKFAPWTIKTAVAFRDRQRAAAFEGYLKSHAGRSFAAKRL